MHITEITIHINNMHYLFLIDTDENQRLYVQSCEYLR